MSISYLAKKRKNELVELAHKVDLPEADVLLKDELVDALQAHLQENESKYGKKKDFIEFYARSGSPVKRERPSPPETGVVAVTKPRQRRQTRLLDQDSPEQATPAKALTTRTPRQVSRVMPQVDTPISPSQVADMAEQQMRKARTKVSELWETYIETSVGFIREKVSSVTAIEAFVLAIEALSLQLNTLQWLHAFDTAPVTQLYLAKHEVNIPDVSLLLKSEFWAPATLWALTSFWIPFVTSYFFNLTLRSNTKHKSSRGTYAADPLVFNMMKMILAYSAYAPTVFEQGGIMVPAVDTWGPFSGFTVGTVRNNVLGGYYGMQIGAVVGILVSIYDAALKK